MIRLIAVKRRTINNTLPLSCTNQSYRSSVVLPFDARCFNIIFNIKISAMITVLSVNRSHFFALRKSYVFILLLITFSSCSVVRVVELEGATTTCTGSGQHYCYRDTVVTSIWKGKNVKSRKTDCKYGI